MKRLLNDVKALRTVRKTPLILKTLLSGVTQQQAMILCDGADGWSILYIICHLCDIEEIFTQRVRDLLTGTNPTFQMTTHEELLTRTDYAAQYFRAMLDAYDQRRQMFIAMLESVNEEQWLLIGVHPTQGPATLLDVAINSGLHDVDHIEQIIRCLNQ